MADLCVRRGLCLRCRRAYLIYPASEPSLSAHANAQRASYDACNRCGRNSSVSVQDAKMLRCTRCRRAGRRQSRKACVTDAWTRVYSCGNRNHRATGPQPQPSRVTSSNTKGRSIIGIVQNLISHSHGDHLPALFCLVV